MLKLTARQYDSLAEKRRAAFVDRLGPALRRALPLEAYTRPELFERAAIDRAVARILSLGLANETHVAAFVRIAIERWGGDIEACLAQPPLAAARARIAQEPGIGADLRFRLLFDAAAGLGATMGRPHPPPPLRPLARLAPPRGRGH